MVIFKNWTFMSFKKKFIGHLTITFASTPAQSQTHRHEHVVKSHDL